MSSYLVATSHDWNVRMFDAILDRLPGDWHLITAPDELTSSEVRKIHPRFIFFPHWSWRVPDEIIEEYECVCFHMTDLPYGRGGSPLQNLILAGHAQTKLTALRMEKEFDTGPIYTKADLSLNGRAQEILERATERIGELIEFIIAEEPEPIPQVGEPTTFKRRRPEESCLPQGVNLTQLYDHIRMLDAFGYPHAFIEYGNYHIYFSHAELVDGRLVARAEITTTASGIHD